MPIEHVIAHRISRPSPDVPSTAKLAEAPWPKDGISEELFRDMKYAVLKRSGKEYGRLSDDRGEAPAASWLEEFSDEKISFETLAKKLADQFATTLSTTEEPLDAFFVVGFETLESDHQVHCFLVQHTHGVYLDGDLKLSQSLQLDVASIRLAVKFNLTDWTSGDDYRQSNAVTLLKWRGEKDLSDAFTLAMGFSDKRDVAKETEAFLEAVNEYTAQLPEEVASHTKKQVVEYCLEQDSAGHAVAVKDLATHVQEQLPSTDQISYTPPPRLDQFIEKTQSATKPELIPDKTQLRNFIRISGRNELLSMSFASSCLGDSITYDADSDSLTVKNIPPSLKNKLIKALKSGG